jgi:hypothetical protein
MKYLNQYNKIKIQDKQPGNSWLHLLRWLRLLIISLSRISETNTNSFNNFQLSVITNFKTTNMKFKNRVIKWATMLLLIFSGTNAMAQGPYPNTGDHQVCLNANEPYGVVLHAGSSYNWTVTPLAGGNGTITVGATPNLITVLWTNVGTATMQVTETNAQGCVGDPVTIIVTIHPIPVLTITNPPAVCTPGTVDLTAAAVTAGSTAGLTLTYWTNAAATIPYATPTAAPAGTYYIKGTSAAGCYDIKPVVVTVAPAPTLVITNPAAVCSPATVDLTAAAVTAGSTGGLTFTYWTDAAGTIPYPTPTAATAGTYYIRGTLSGGCNDIKPVTVTVNPKPTVVTNNPAAVCAPATVDLTVAAVTAGSTAGLTYTYWTDAAATIAYPTPTAATAGTYYIKGTSAAGCTDIQPVTVTITAIPTVVITNPAAVCSPATVDITAAAVTAGSAAGLTYTYWTDAAATIAYPTPTAATAGTYYIKGTSAAGCSDIKPVTVTINPLPAPIITGPSPVCESISGSTATYSTPNIAGHTYTWTVTGGTITTGQNTNSVTVSWTAPGAATISVTETITAGGCTATVNKSITVTPKPVTTPITHN